MNNVKELRERMGLSQKELSVSIGVSQPTVSEWEHKKKDPSGDRLTKLSELFGVSRSVILGYDPITKPMIDEDDETFEIRERLRRDPEYRLLFDAARKATPEHLKAAAAMLKALEPEEPDVD